MPTTVTASNGDETATREITDTYSIICDGTAYVAGTQIHRKADGTVTHVITVKGGRS